MKVGVKSFVKARCGNIELNDAIFGVEVRKDIISRVTDWQLAKRREGTHHSKGISDIRGTTAKPWRQKGTGRARHGSRRSPQFRGGAVTFGPKTRSHAYRLNKKIKRLGLKMALSSKLHDKKLIVLEDLKLGEGKTSHLSELLHKLGVASALVIDGENIDKDFALASSNLINIDILSSAGLNVYDIMRLDYLICSKRAIDAISERLI